MPLKVRITFFYFKREWNISVRPCDLKRFPCHTQLPVAMGRCDGSRLISICASGARDNFLLGSSSH